MKISSMLHIGRGVTALIGGGGKTTLLYTLAEELRRKGTVLLCTSTHILVPEGYFLETGGEEALRAALAAHGAVCAGTHAENGKLTAPQVSFERMAELADYVLVEADGAKRLPLKAHGSHEPVIPGNAARTVLVLGADGFGRPVGEVCHRPELYAERACCGAEECVTPEIAARLLLAEGLGDRIFINKVEDAGGYAAAERLARLLPWPVTAGSLRQGVYVCLS